MATGKKQTDDEKVIDLRYEEAKRKNIPPAGLAARGKLVKETKAKYGYNPHLPPALRFDATGRADRLNELLAKLASTKQLSDDEIIEVQALAQSDPWLEWSGKREQPECVVDPVALQVHERISTQAILRVAAREDVPRTLFADPEQEYREAVQFYQHDVDWANRLILGDSLAVMASLARREGLAGKVQMIYMDPPYGIKYASNFQSEVGKRDVKDKDEDLTREPEMVKAYRDTWTLGVHSYLSYLRDRLLLARELLADTGSIFVQISDENVHRVRNLLEEVFGAENFQAQIAFKSKSALGRDGLAKVFDHLIWFSKNHEAMKFRALFSTRDVSQDKEWRFVESDSGHLYRMEEEEAATVSNWSHVFRRYKLTSSGFTPSCTFAFNLDGALCKPFGGKSWATNQEGIERTLRAGRLFALSGSPYMKQMFADFPVQKLENAWTDQPAAESRDYVVQTARKFVERCMLMTTDPGDLVLDPTCGSGTTAFVAESYGRRWITIDTSRVAVAIARQRLLTARLDHYRMRSLSAVDVTRNPSGTWLTDPSGILPGPVTLDCKTVPHVTLKSIAQNQALDGIFARWEPQLKRACEDANAQLRTIPVELRAKLLAKAKASIGDKKANSAGNDLPKLKKALSDADWRRWVLPPDIKATRNYTAVENGFEGWYEWEMPFGVDPEWPQALQDAVTKYRELWTAKTKEVNACIAARADQEELVDQPYKIPNVLRVTGPFTVEGVIPVEESIDVDEPSPIGAIDDDLETFEEGASVEPVAAASGSASNADSYLDQMVSLLRKDGVRFLNNKVLSFSRLERVNGLAHHAEGEWENGPTGNASKLVYVVFGPQYGPITSIMVEDAIRAARRADVLLFAGFSFNPEAQSIIQEVGDPRLQVEMVQIRPDANPAMGGLLKNTVHQQLFTVSGTPRTRVDKTPDGELLVTMEGVDIYDPIENAVRSSGADKVAAWFLDGDYDGRTFCVTQAFFPDKTAWEKIAKHLDKSGAIDMDRFEAFSGTTSLPFPTGKHKRVAVKVIDPRGNEVMKVHRLEGYQA